MVVERQTKHKDYDGTVKIIFMRIEGIIWLNTIVDKLATKHHVAAREVEELFDNRPKFRFVERGDYKGEDVYMALGQTDTGRYLIVLFI